MQSIVYVNKCCYKIIIKKLKKKYFPINIQYKFGENEHLTETEVLLRHTIDIEKMLQKIQR